MRQTYEAIDFRTDGEVARLTLNRPDQLNALTAQMLDEIDDAVDHINERDDIKTVVLGGAGRAFCAGRDTDELDDVRAPAGSVPKKGGFATVRIADIEVPVVCAVRGAVVGGGLGMVLMCDTVIASTTARFIDGHVAVGMCPSSSVWWLPRISGYQQAMDVFLTGKRFSAEDGVRLGFVSEIVDDDELEDAAAATASAIAKAPRSALITTKRAVRFAMESSFTRSLEQVAYLRAL